MDITSYLALVEDILTHEAVLSMSAYIQHRDLSCLEHSIYVSFTSYCLAYKLKMDSRQIARAALLHDFFLYDWHVGRPTRQMHGFAHPKLALYNAQTHFNLTEVEKDIILKHMWPLTFRPPAYKESLLVNAVDKYCSTLEIISPYHRHKIKTLTKKLLTQIELDQ